MKKIYTISVIIAILSHFQFFIFADQKAEFKGKIEVKNGIKIIKNPSEPLYETSSSHLTMTSSERPMFPTWQ